MYVSVTVESSSIIHTYICVIYPYYSIRLQCGCPHCCTTLHAPASFIPSPSVIPSATLPPSTPAVADPALPSATPFIPLSSTHALSPRMLGPNHALPPSPQPRSSRDPIPALPSATPIHLVVVLARPTSHNGEPHPRPPLVLGHVKGKCALGQFL
jgi:hypothetical protein